MSDDFAEYAHRKAEFQAMLDRGEQVWFSSKSGKLYKAVGMMPDATEQKVITMDKERPFTTVGDAVESDTPVLPPDTPPQPLPSPKPAKDAEHE